MKENSFLNTKWNILLLSVSTAQQAQADINMKDASFFKTWQDPIAPRDRRDMKFTRGRRNEDQALKVERTYQSRSLQRGVFGFGWSSNLDNLAASAKPHLHGQAVTFNAEGLISTIGPLRYAYSDAGDLVTVFYGANRLYRYHYDELHNLTQITYPDGSTEKIEYDKDQDRPISYEDRIGCREKYEFTPGVGASFTAVVEKSCRNHPLQRSTYNFKYKDTALERVLVTTDISETEILYDVSTGQIFRTSTKNRSLAGGFEDAIKGNKYVPSTISKSGANR